MRRAPIALAAHLTCANVHGMKASPRNASLRKAGRRGRKSHTASPGGGRGGLRRGLLIAIAVLCLLGGCTANHRGHPGHSDRTVRHPSAHGSSIAGSAGEPGSAWRILAGHQGGIEGYANRSSVSPGQSVRLFVSTAAPRFVVRAFRMGWYRGALGRQVWSSAPIRGRRQSAPVITSSETRTVTARWAPSVAVWTGGWSPGDYLLRLDASSHREAFIPLTVRGPSAAGRIVLVNAVTTWQAYNRWGCCDLYQGGDGAFATRSRAVSFDRPYAANDGSGEFIDRELGIVAEAERLSLPLDYVTDVDLDTNPHLLDRARAVVSMGHDEYWSPRMRAAVTTARDAGTNLAFFGANAIFRRIRFAATSLGSDRLEIDYKVAAEDPLYGTDNPAVTADWPASPDARPESTLVGAQYGCFPGGRRVSGVIVDPTSWLFAGTHVTQGEDLTGLIGPETDAVQLSYPTPRPIEVLLHSPTRCPAGNPAYADSTYYVASSDAAVFDAGTIDWVCAVGTGCHARISAATHTVTRQVTDNLLRAFARGPAGRLHPAHDNVTALGISCNCRIGGNGHLVSPSRRPPAAVGWLSGPSAPVRSDGRIDACLTRGSIWSVPISTGSWIRQRG